MRFKPRFSAVLDNFSSAEGCGCLAEGRVEGLRFECGQYGRATERGVQAVHCTGAHDQKRGPNTNFHSFDFEV